LSGKEKPLNRTKKTAQSRKGQAMTMNASETMGELCAFELALADINCPVPSSAFRAFDQNLNALRIKPDKTPEDEAIFAKMLGIEPVKNAREKVYCTESELFAQMTAEGAYGIDGEARDITSFKISETEKMLATAMSEYVAVVASLLSEKTEVLQMQHAYEAFLEEDHADTGCLPKGFNCWDWADDKGWTVAHEAANHRKLPEDFDRWELEKEGKTVAAVVLCSYPEGLPLRVKAQEWLDAQQEEEDSGPRP
jgi:hypothetical protein